MVIHYLFLNWIAAAELSGRFRWESSLEDVTSDSKEILTFQFVNFLENHVNALDFAFLDSNLAIAMNDQLQKNKTTANQHNRLFKTNLPEAKSSENLEPAKEKRVNNKSKLGTKGSKKFCSHCSGDYL